MPRFFLLIRYICRQQNECLTKHNKKMKNYIIMAAIAAGVCIAIDFVLPQKVKQDGTCTRFAKTMVETN